MLTSMHYSDWCWQGQVDYGHWALLFQKIVDLFRSSWHVQLWTRRELAAILMFSSVLPWTQDPPSLSYDDKIWFMEHAEADRNPGYSFCRHKRTACDHDWMCHHDNICMSPWQHVDMSPRQHLDVSPRQHLDMSPWQHLDVSPWQHWMCHHIACCLLTSTISTSLVAKQNATRSCTLLLL